MMRLVALDHEDQQQEGSMFRWYQTASLKLKPKVVVAEKDDTTSSKLSAKIYFKEEK